MATEVQQVPKWPREGYNEEWLALEDAAGGRYILGGDIAKSSPEFNTTFAAIAKMWPPLTESLDIIDNNTGLVFGNMPVRIYRPNVEGSLPLMVHFPGGGFFSGNLNTEDYQARYFAVKSPCVVVSVEYPKAPAMNIDGIIEHGAMAVRWARSNASTFGANATKTLLCGGSAGSVLSEQVAYHFMANGEYDTIAGCVLLYTAAVHWDYQGPYKHMHTCWDDNGHSQVPLFGLEEAKSMWSSLEFRPEDPRHFVFMAKDLSKFPPCYLMSTEKCCFRDGGKMMEHRLQEAGVKCKYDFYPGLPHWFHVFPQLSASHEMMVKTVEGIKFLLGQQSDIWVV